MSSFPLTYKQLEAFYWIVELNSFRAAADRLCTSQSAISKRIQDLESGLETTLFDRSKQPARLTSKGEAFWLVARDLLEQRDTTLRRFHTADSTPVQIRLGVSELTAMTWLPQYVKKIKQLYPTAELHPDVDTTLSITEKLKLDQLDLIIVPQVLVGREFSQTALSTVEHIWVCAPQFLNEQRPMRAEELVTHALLIQHPEIAVPARLLSNWMETRQLPIKRAIRCNSVSGLIGMALSGIGIAYLPRGSASALLERGELREVHLLQTPPPVVMVAAHTPQPDNHYIHNLVAIALSCCNFERTM